MPFSLTTSADVTKVTVSAFIIVQGMVVMCIGFGISLIIAVPIAIPVPAVKSKKNYSFFDHS